MIRLILAALFVGWILWFVVRNREPQTIITETQVDGMVFCTWLQGERADTLQQPCPQEVSAK